MSNEIKPNDNHENQHESSVSNHDLSTPGPKPSIIGIFTGPNKQWERIRERPNFFLALLMVTFLTMAGTYLMMSAIPFDTAGLGDELGDEIGSEEMEMAAIMIQVVGTVGAMFVSIITILILTVIHLIATTIGSTGIGFKQLFSMNTYIYLISACGIFFNGVISLLIGYDGIAPLTSVGSLVEAEGLMAGVLSQFEFFSIWYFILMALGLNKMAGLKGSTSWILTAAIFLAYMLFASLGGDPTAM